MQKSILVFLALSTAGFISASAPAEQAEESVIAFVNLRHSPHLNTRIGHNINLFAKGDKPSYHCARTINTEGKVNTYFLVNEQDVDKTQIPSSIRKNLLNLLKQTTRIARKNNCYANSISSWDINAAGEPCLLKVSPCTPETSKD